MIFFHFASIAGCGYEFHVGILRGNCRRYKFWPCLNFLLEQQIKIVLTFIFFNLRLASRYSTLLKKLLMERNILQQFPTLR